MIELFYKNKQLKFLVFKLPLSILFLILFVELLSFSLSNHRAVRHDLDKKVAYLENFKINKYKDTILFGDSVTQDVANIFNLNQKNNIINLTTNRASGLIGVYFLYKRYRTYNDPPKRIFISCTPLFLNYFPTGNTKELYLDSVFNNEYERNMILNFEAKSLKNQNEGNFLNYLKKDINLSIFNIKERIVYPFINFSGFVNINNSIKFGNNKLPDFSDLELLKNNFIVQKKYNFNLDTNFNLKITKQMDLILNKFFELLKEDNVKLFILWAPVRNSYLVKIEENGELRKYEKFLKIKLSKYNHDSTIYNFSKEHDFVDFAFRGNDHLWPGYWKKLYAVTLNKFISSKEILK